MYAIMKARNIKEEVLSVNIIRKAGLEDAAAIARLNRDALGYEYPPGETRKKLAQALACEKEMVFVAVCGEEIVGYIHACDYDVLYAPHMKDVLGIAVSGTHRKKGLGAALLGAVEQWARATGAAGVRLVSGGSRADAHAFYRHCGYVDGKEQLNFKKML